MKYQIGDKVIVINTGYAVYYETGTITSVEVTRHSSACYRITTDFGYPFNHQLRKEEYLMPNIYGIITNISFLTEEEFNAIRMQKAMKAWQ